MRLDESCDLPVGTRDAVHCPFVVIQNHDWKLDLKPGDWVRFKDDTFTTIEPCEKKDAHGLINPFINELSTFEGFVVFIVPGIATDVEHTFKINPDLKRIRQVLLEIELKQVQAEDEACAGCWEIRNNRVIRN